MKRGELYRVYKGSSTDKKDYRVFVIVSRQVLINSKYSTVTCAPIYSNYIELSTQVKVGIVLLVIFAFIFFFTTIPRYKLKRINELVTKKHVEKKELSDEELIKEILMRHPSWNRKKLEDIFRGLD